MDEVSLRGWVFRRGPDFGAVGTPWGPGGGNVRQTGRQPDRDTETKEGNRYHTETSSSEEKLADACMQIQQAETQQPNP